MATHLPYCKKCKHPADDQDIKVQSIFYTSLGTVEAHLECCWCGHMWTKESPTLAKLHAERCRNYANAVREAKSSGHNISILHR